MSFLTKCNFCKLKVLEEIAKEQGKSIHLRNSNEYGGVYVHELGPGEPVNTADWDEGNPQIRAWFMELSDSCVC
jgi:hypothetical protein